MTGSGTRPRVVLVGPMGAGKTTVAQLLASQWDVGSQDTDHDVETRAGRPISEIFVDDGEQAFRSLEREAVIEALRTHGGVVALGGGAVLDASAREALRGHRVVFLNVGLSDAVKRVGLGSARPLLLGNVRAQVKALLDQRLPVYEEVAEITVDTDGKTPEAVARDVREAVEGAEAPGAAEATESR